MSSFFTDESSHKFGIVNSSGNFVELSAGSENWKQEHGDVCVKLFLKARGGGTWNNLWKDIDKSPALLYVTLQMSEDNTVWTDVKTFNIGLMDQIIDAHGSHTLPAGTVYEIEKDMYGNFMEVGDDIPRSRWYYTRLSFRCTYNPIDELVKDYSSWGGDARYKASDPTPPDITSSHLATVKVSSACHYDNYAAAFVGGSSTRTAELNITSSNFARPKFKVTLQLMNPENPTSNCSKYYYYPGGIPQANGNNGQMIRNSAENNDTVKFQYSTDNGSTWQTAKTFYPDSSYVDEKSSGFGGVNVFRSFEIQGNNKDRDNLKFRLTQSSSGGFNDMIIMDALKVYRPNYSSQFYWDARQYTQNVIILPGMFKFDTATLRLKSSDSSPSGLSPIISDFFKIEDTNSANGTITPDVTLAQVEADIKAESTQTQAFVGDQYEISRCSYIKVTVILNGVGTVVQNFEDREGSHILVAGVNTGITSGDRSWYVLNTYPQPAQSMGKMVIDISSLISMHHLFTGGTFSVAFEAIGKRKNNTEFVIDSTASTITWSPVHNFDIAESVNPWNYITYPPPGKVGSTGQYVHDPFANYSNATPAAQSQIGINTMRIQSTATTASAVKYKIGVYSTKVPSYLLLESVDGCADNGTLIATGSDKRITLKSGTNWYNTATNINFYGTGSIDDPGLSVYTWAYQSTTETNTYLEAFHNTTVNGNHRNKWTFKSNYGVNGSGMDFYPTINKEKGTWSIPNIVFYTTQSNASAFWFRIYMEHRAHGRGGATHTKILDRWFPGCPPVPGQSLGGGGDTYFYQIDGFIEDERLSQYFTSVYDYPEDELRIRVYAYGNIPGNGSIAYANSDWIPIQQDYGLQPANLRAIHSFPQIVRIGTSNTQTSFRLASTFDFAYAGGEYEAHYFRVDVYEDDPSIVAINDVPLSSSNLLGIYYTYGVAGAGIYTDVAANDTDAYRNVFIKATGFSNFMGKVNAEGNHVYGAISLSEFQNSLYTRGDYIVQMRAIADDGQYLPIRPYHGETESQNPSTDIRERFTYEPAQWTFASSGGNQTIVTILQDKYKEAIINGTAIENEVYIKVKAGATNTTRAMFDYMTIDLTGENGVSKSFNLPFNGSTYYYEVNPVNFETDSSSNKMDIQDLLNARTTGTDVDYTIKAWAKGKDLTDNNYEVVDEFSGVLPVWDISWNFDTHSVTMITPQDLDTAPIRVKLKSNDGDGITSSPSNTQMARRFKLVVKNTTTNDTVTYYLSGVIFDGSEFTYTTDINGNTLDVIDIINKTTDRTTASPGTGAGHHTLSYTLTAQQQYDNGTYFDVPSTPANTAEVSAMVTWLDLDFNISDVAISFASNTPDSVILNIDVTKTRNDDIANRIIVYVQENATLSGNVNSSHKRTDYSLTSADRLGRITGQRTQRFTLDITNFSEIDRFDATQLKISVRPAYYPPGGGLDGANTWRWYEGATVKYLGASEGWYPFFKIDSSATAVKVKENNINFISVEINVRGEDDSSLTLTPTAYNFSFKDSKTGAQILDIARTPGQVLPDQDHFTAFNIQDLYTSQRGEDHEISCEITPIYGGGPGNPTYFGGMVTKAVTIPAESKIKFDPSSRRGMLLDSNGNEYWAARFKPQQVNGPSDFFPDDAEWYIDIVLKEDKHNQIVASKTYKLAGEHIERVGEGDVDAKYIAVTIKTGVNVYADLTHNHKYYAEFRAYYDVAEGRNNYRVNSDLDTTSFKRDDNTFQMIHHKFPKVLETLVHNFDANGDGQLEMSFEERSDGAPTGYSDGRNDTWEFEIEAIEIVEDSLDDTQEGQSTTVTGITDVEFDTNAIPFVPHIPREANYESKFQLKIIEKYNNKAAVDNPSYPGQLLSTGWGRSENLEVEAPDWNDTFDFISEERIFEKTNVTVNDITNYPNTTVVPTDIVITDIPGNYAVSGRRITFNVPLDFEDYFTNAEPFFAFGLKIEYKDLNGNTRSTLSSYIDSTGHLHEGDNIAPEKLNLVKTGSIYNVKDFGTEGGQYYIDIELDPSRFTYNFNPDFTEDIQYTLMVYLRDDLLSVQSPNNKKETTEPSDANGNPITYERIEDWAESPVAVKENWNTKSLNANEWTPLYSNFNVQPKENDNTKFDYFFEYEIDDYNKKAYQFTEINARWVGQFKNNSDVKISSEFTPTTARTYQGGDKSATYTLDLTHLDDNNFNPFEDIKVDFIPRMTLDTKVDNSYHFGIDKEVPALKKSYTINYRDLIVPTFDSLSKDDSLNQDTINNNNTEFTNKVVWFYNKVAKSKACFTTEQEWVVLRRKIRQGEKVFYDEELHSQKIYLYGTAAAKRSHDTDTNKYVYTDSNINLDQYVTDGLNTSEAFVFEYEITPMFRYGKTTTTDTEIPEKKISTFLIPDEFPLSNNGIRNLSTHSIHQDKHSIHLKWDHQYVESLDTFRGIDAKVHFDLYWYVDETDSQKQVKEKLKPKRRKMERISAGQNISSDWNFIDTVDYVYPSSPNLNQFYPFSYLWEYDKLETDFNIRVAVITRIESNIVGSLSQTIGTIGANNSFVLDVRTSDKARKRKMHNDDELKRTPNRHLKREQEFTSSLSQVPFTVTRKKAKPRGSDKPYSSST